MKKGALVLTAAIVICSFVSNASTDEGYYKKISNVVKNNWEDNYIEAIKFNIGENIMTVNGEEKKIDVDDNVVPIIKEGRTMLPARTIIEQLDANIEFNEVTQEVSVEVDDIDMTLTIGKNKMDVQGESKELDVAPVIENGRTLLPVRAITESIGMDVEWNEEEQEITLKNDLQLKRIIVKTNGKVDFSKYNPIDIIEGEEKEYILQFNSLGDTKIAYEELGKAEDVISIELDKIVSLESVDVRNIEYRSWGAEKMHVNEYIQYLTSNNKNSEVVVGVIDTGFNLSHDFLKGRIKEGGYNFWGGNSNLNEEGMNNHGTHVSAVVTDLTQGTNVKILPLKVFGEGGTTTNLVIKEAMKYAIEKEVDVINLSISFDENDITRYNISNKAIERGIVVVNSAGNEGKDKTKAAEPMDDVIFVGSVDSNNNKSSFSSYGEYIDVVAPGEEILTLKNGKINVRMYGTSFSAPHVAAIAALYKLDNPSLGVVEIENLIKKHVDDIGEAGEDIYYGAGIPNLSKAIAKEKVIKDVSWNNRNIELKQNDKYKVTLIATYDDGTTRNVFDVQDCIISDKSVIDLTSDGTMIALKDGIVTIQSIKYPEANKIQVLVKPVEKTIKSVKFNQTSIELYEGESTKVKLEVKYSDGSVEDITKQCTYINESSSIASIDKEGTIKALKAGTTWISAEQYDAGEIEIVVKKVPEKEEPKKTIKSIGWNVRKLEMYEGESQNVKLEIKYSDGSVEDITKQCTYINESSSIASIDKAGTIKALKAGTTWISAEQYDAGEIEVVVKKVPEKEEPKKAIKSIGWNEKGLEIEEGQTAKVKVEITYSDGSVEDITRQCTYVNTSSSVASISSDGTVKGLKVGKTWITPKQYDINPLMVVVY